MSKPKKHGKVVMSSYQKSLYQQVRKFVEAKTKEGPQSMDFPKDLKAADRKFIEGLAQSLRLQYVTIEDDNQDRFVRLSFYPSVEDDDSEAEEEGNLALQRVFKAFEKAQIIDVSPDDAKAEMEKLYQQKFYDWRDEYYKVCKICANI